MSCHRRCPRLSRRARARRGGGNAREGAAVKSQLRSTGPGLQCTRGRAPRAAGDQPADPTSSPPSPRCSLQQASPAPRIPRGLCLPLCLGTCPGLPPGPGELSAPHPCSGWQGVGAG